MALCCTPSRFVSSYLCSASNLASEMSKTLTMPELKPQENTCRLEWKATEQGLSSEAKSYSCAQGTTKENAHLCVLYTQTGTALALKMGSGDPQVSLREFQGIHSYDR